MAEKVSSRAQARLHLDAAERWEQEVHEAWVSERDQDARFVARCESVGNGRHSRG